MKAKLLQDFYYNNLHKEDSILNKIGTYYEDIHNNSIHEDIVENNPAIFELIEDKVEYVKITGFDYITQWHYIFINEIFKVIEEKFDCYSVINQFMAGEGYIISKNNCTPATKQEYIDCLNKQIDKLKKLVDNENEIVCNGFPGCEYYYKGKCTAAKAIKCSKQL